MSPFNLTSRKIVLPVSGIVLVSLGVVIYVLWWSLPAAPPPAIDTNEYTAYFLQQESESGDIMSVDSRGPLVLDDAGCLRLGDEEGSVILWPASGYTVDLIQGDVALVDEQTDDVIAYVGEWINLGGIRPGGDNPDRLIGHQLPDACAEADHYAAAGGAGGIERIEPDEQLRETMNWNEP